MILELVHRDALAAIIPALPIPACADLRALPVGRREDGQPWAIRLHGSHLVLAGARAQVLCRARYAEDRLAEAVL